VFDAKQFTQYVIKPALEAIDLYSESAEQLLLGTACAESKLGTYLHQIQGPALGVFQMEPVTHDDLWNNYLIYRPELQRQVIRLTPYTGGLMPPASLMLTDLRYAAIMARLLYRRSPMALQKKDDWAGAAEVWKKVYNTYLGSGTVNKFLRSLATCKVTQPA